MLILTSETRRLTTREALFAHIALHLLAQGEPSIHEEIGCAYRSDDGALACAMGCVIADEHYIGEFEGYSITPDAEADECADATRQLREALSASLGRWLTDADTTILLRLQELHDGRPRWNDMLNMIDDLQDEAARLGVSWTPPSREEIEARRQELRNRHFAVARGRG